MDPALRLAAAGRAMKNERGLRKVLADEFGHLEHIDDRLAAEHDLERDIRVDIALVLCVLELVFLDVERFEIPGAYLRIKLGQ